MGSLSYGGGDDEQLAALLQPQLPLQCVGLGWIVAHHHMGASSGYGGRHRFA